MSDKLKFLAHYGTPFSIIFLTFVFIFSLYSVGAIVWFIAAGVATACGVGGGGIYVPLGIILLRFSSKPSSGLSQASIFGASVGGLILNLRNKHPDEKIRDTVGKRDNEHKVIPYEKGMTKAEIQQDEQLYLCSKSDSGDQERRFYSRPLIDYDMALFLAPMEMAGAVMGVIIQRLMPNWLFLTLAGIILGFTSYKTFTKFQSSYTSDKKKREEQKMTEDSNEGDGDKDVVPDVDMTPANIAENDVNINPLEGEKSANASLNDDETLIIQQDDAEKLAKRRKLLEEDERQYPLEKIAGLVLLWIGLAVITFLKGGKGVESLVGITCKSPWFAVLTAAQFLWLLGFSLFYGYALVRKNAIKVENNYPFHENDVLWDRAKLRFYATFTFIAGIVAGLIGIGGGMVLGPLMLVMGIHPRVSSATTATMIVLTSSSVAIMFVTSGLVPWEYAVFFFCVCFCGAFIGKKYIDGYVKKTGMASVLIGILAAIIGFATIGCFAIVILNLKNADWCFDGFKKFCVVKEEESEQCSANQFRALMEGLGRRD